MKLGSERRIIPSIGSVFDFKCKNMNWRRRGVYVVVSKPFVCAAGRRLVLLLWSNGEISEGLLERVGDKDDVEL